MSASLQLVPPEVAPLRLSFVMQQKLGPWEGLWEHLVQPKEVYGMKLTLHLASLEVAALRRSSAKQQKLGPWEGSQEHLVKPKEVFCSAPQDGMKLRLGLVPLE